MENKKELPETSKKNLKDFIAILDNKVMKAAVEYAYDEGHAVDDNFLNMLLAVRKEMNLSHEYTLIMKKTFDAKAKGKEFAASTLTYETVHLGRKMARIAIDRELMAVKAFFEKIGVQDFSAESYLVSQGGTLKPVNVRN